MNKTTLMLKAEERINEEIENFLSRTYNVDWKSSINMGKILGVHDATVRRWLIKLGIELRKGPEEYISRRIRRPPNGALNYYYNFIRKPVAEAAEERGVCPKTFYRWLEKAGIERRNGSDRYLERGISKPSNNKLAKLLSKHTQIEIARMHKVNQHTIRKWKQKAGLHKFRKSKYDNKGFRKERIVNLLEMTRKRFEQLRYDDFFRNQQENGNSFRSFLDWYLSHYRCGFDEAKKYMKRDYRTNNINKSQLESSIFSK